MYMRSEHINGNADRDYSSQFLVDSKKDLRNGLELKNDRNNNLLLELKGQTVTATSKRFSVPSYVPAYIKPVGYDCNVPKQNLAHAKHIKAASMPVTHPHNKKRHRLHSSSCASVDRHWLHRFRERSLPTNNLDDNSESLVIF